MTGGSPRQGLRFDVVFRVTGCASPVSVRRRTDRHALRRQHSRVEHRSQASGWSRRASSPGGATGQDVSWFGIRGGGSIFYLMQAINHGLPEALAKELIAITLTSVAASILLHGISVTPLMSLYAHRKMLRRRRP